MNKAVNITYDLSEDTRIREMARIRENLFMTRLRLWLMLRRKGFLKGA